MANVYFAATGRGCPMEDVQRKSRALLAAVVDREGVELEREIPLKVHFGEAGNETFLRPATYRGVVDYLAERGIASSYIETTVLYGGKRYRKDLHLQTAAEHGFTDLPIVIADGEAGGDYYSVPIGKRHFAECKLGAAFAPYPQVIVLAHFKGHAMAGFGGAIKQLSMGFASKGGKLAMHMGVKPRIIKRKCRECGLCASRCAEDAIEVGRGRSRIDHGKCVGCGACVAVCPHQAATIISVAGVLKFLGVGNNFIEKLVEYAYAAHAGRRNVYLNYVMNVTAGCDCEGRKMKPIAEDVGIFASLDPVALDKACWDALAAAGKTLKGARTFAYAERIGLGSARYELLAIDA